MSDVDITQNNINADNAKKIKKISRLEGLHKLKSDPPELPFVSIITIEPQVLEMVGRLIHILNDPVLFTKFKQTIHKKFDLTIHNIDNQINNNPTKGGGESYFTQEECSFF